MNKKLMMFSPLLIMFAVSCTKNLDTDTKKASYAIGQQIGQNLKSQNIEIDPDALAMSLKDAIKGTEPKLTKEQQVEALNKLQENVRKKMEEEAAENKKVGGEFLEKNKSKSGVKVTATGLQYEVITEGTGKTPTKDDQVKCHYVGTLINGTEFDSSVKRGQPAVFPVSGVIPGWTEALQMMKTGSKWKLYIPPELAYGTNPRPGIPGNSVLIFEVELLEIMPPMDAPPSTKKRK